MKHYRKETRTYTNEEDVLIKETCDWCQEEIKDHLNSNSWGVDDFTLEWKTGTAYPEGGSGQEKEVELCQKCKNKLFELLEKKGIEVQKRDWDY